MGLEDIAVVTTPLLSVAEVWGHVLFWSFLMTTLTYVSVGIVCALCLRQVRKGVSFLVPLAFFGCGELMVLGTDAIASAFVAGVYATAGWTMTSGAAFGWGLGLSLLNTLLNAVISRAPLYCFM